MWNRRHAYFLLHEESWDTLHHRRSNTETAFSMFKGSSDSWTETGRRRLKQMSMRL